MIGDDVRVLLGMIPVRDRAGIARSNMAIEAEKAAAAQSDGNAEGQALTRQGFDFARAAPPPVSLPPTMGQPEPDAANMPVANGAPAQFAIPPGSIGGASGTPPVPTERVVASASAAAPRGSEIMLQALQRQARQQQMMQVVASLGMIGNAFNRNPASQAATRNSLAGMIGGGGGGGGGDAGTLKTLLDMRAKEEEAIKSEADRENLATHFQRTLGWDRERALAATADPKVAAEYMKPEYGIKREEAKREGKVRMDLSKPEVIAELAKRNGVPEEVIRADIDKGKITSKDLTDIAKDLATTGKTIAETGEMGRSTAEKQRADIEYQFYKEHPEAYRQLHGLENVEEARRILSTRPAYDKYQETSGPTAYADEAAYHNYRRQEIAAGNKPKSREEWVALKSVKPTLEEKGQEQVLKQVTTRLDETQTKALTAKSEIEGRSRMMQDLWSKGLRSGSKLSPYKLDARKAFADALGVPVGPEDIKTERFFTLMNQGVLDRVRDLPGPLSDRDREFMTKLNGDMTITPDTIDYLAHFKDKMNRLEIKKHRQEKEGEVNNLSRAEGIRKTAASYRDVDYPPPNAATRREVDKHVKPEYWQGIKTVADPKTRAVLADKFDAEYGLGTFEHLAREKGIAP